ncbi:MAG: c-type cytochrome [Pseudomonadota bacterium]
MRALRNITRRYIGTLQRNTIVAFLLSLAWVGCGASSIALADENVLKKGEIKPALIFRKSCSVCHGDRGNGQGRASVNLNPPPRDFTQASNLTREMMINAVTYGKPGTAMMAWRTRYDDKQIEAVVDYIRGRFMLAVLDPRMGLGRGVYGHFCQICHGDRGQGVKSAEMNGAAPRDLTAPQMQSILTRERLITVISKGAHGSSIPAGFAEKLSAENIGAVADYMRKVLLPQASEPQQGEMSSPIKAVATPSQNGSATQPAAASPASEEIGKGGPADMSLPMPQNLAGDIKRGEKFFMANCAACHGKGGYGDGPRASFLNPRPRNFHDDFSHTYLNRPALFSIITNGKPGTVMPAWGKVLNDQEIANVGEFVFQTFVQEKVRGKASTK